jgi:hypothetical protein
MELSIAGALTDRGGGAAAGGRHRISFDRKKATLELLGMTLIETRLAGDLGKKMCRQRGVAVLVADRDSEAYRGGVRTGNIIAEVNSSKICSLHDFTKVLKHHELHAPLFIFLMTADGWRFTNLSFIGSCSIGD